MSVKKLFTLSSSTPLTVNKTKGLTLSVAEGFSLIEVIIFVAILSIFLISSVSVITVLTRQNTMRVNMLKAAHYNEQLLDWIRIEKETDWRVFAGNAWNNTICFASDDIRWSAGVLDKDSCTSGLGGSYRRYAVFATDNPAPLSTQVQVTVYTEWTESGNSYSTKLHAIFNIWE